MPECLAETCRHAQVCRGVLHSCFEPHAGGREERVSDLAQLASCLVTPKTKNIDLSIHQC